MKAFSRFLISIIGTTFCISCDGGPLDPEEVINASPGGIWVGVDPSRGGQIVMVATEGGTFRLVNQAQNQGFGVLSVSNGNDVSSNFQLVTELGFTFPDGTTIADCTLSGTIAERQAMTVAITCTTTSGLLDEINTVLDYDATYERDSSLATIAGVYVDRSGIVANIAEDGTIFVQDPLFGCVTNGLVSVIDSDFNAYEYQFEINNCTGLAAVFNGTSYSGIASLGSTVTQDLLIVAATGEVAGTLVSIIIVANRL